MLVKVLVSLLVLNSVFADYTNYRLLRISPKTQLQINLVGEWQHNPDFDVWAVDTDHIDASLSPEAFRLYAEHMDKNGIQYNILNDNIQKNIDQEQLDLQAILRKAKTLEERVVNTFATLPDAYAWMDGLAAANNYVTTEVIGKSYENRDLKVIRIKKPTTTRKIWIDCGIHAREWISPSSCIYIIDALIRETNANNAEAVAITNYYEFVILPYHNPDGYAYSYSSSANRLWRKNRRVNSGSTCIGVDLNRNFGYQWMVAGASNNPCADTYAGPTPDSEAETKAVEAVINSARGSWDAFFTIHTYGQFWFTPWGYTSALPSDYSELVAKSNIGVAALKAVNGLTFRVGSSTNLLYAAAGGSDDWAKGVAGVKYSHCLELRPSDTGVDSSYGFQLPVDRAPKAGEETYRGIAAFCKALIA